MVRGDFYRWGSIFRGASQKETLTGKLRHVAYAGGWKKFEPMWDLIIRAKRAGTMLPVLEQILTGFGRHGSAQNRRTNSLQSQRGSNEAPSTSPSCSTLTP